MAPSIFLVGVGEMQIARELLSKAESGRSLSLVLCPLEFGLDDEMVGTPGVCEVDQFQIH